jgi:fructose-bisphosphate aldolase/6-deoxy-5-ketofructose 1-phosphate synthase
MTYQVRIPLDVPEGAKGTYVKNYDMVTHGSGRLMLFAGDQKVEHLNDDFYGAGVHPDDSSPEHLFSIASRAKIGCFAVQLGLIARYGMDYPDLPYLVKLNSKTNIVPLAQAEPSSRLIHSVRQVVRFRETSGVRVVGVGYTIYLGSDHEAVMLSEAADVIISAHQYGLITVLWIYPRGKAVKDERDPHLIAGATGVAACLGSDFVKVSPPKKDGRSSPDLLREAVLAAGRTGVVCAGGSKVAGEEFLRQLHDQIHIGGTAGNATGRNIHQKSLPEAVRMCDAIYAITVEGSSVEDAVMIYEGK